MIKSKNVALQNTYNPWWLPPEISYSTCTNVYQFKDAVSADNSLMNLSGYSNSLNMTIVGTPKWTRDTGWIFDLDYNQRLIFSVGGNTSTIIVKFSNAAQVTLPNTNYRGVAGVQDAYACQPNTGNGVVWWNNTPILPDWTNGFLAFQRTKCYRDGVLEYTSNDFYTNKTWFVGGNPCSIQAVAVYNVNLTAAQIVAVGNAMNAL